MALGYILAKASSKPLKTNLNVPLALTLSVIPDIDILLERINGLSSVFPHRGPLHSFVAALIVFVPVFAVYRRRAVPYFIALVQHALIGDYLTGGQLQLLWPLSQEQFGIATSIQSLQNVVLEATLFVVSIAVLLASRDIAKLFQRHYSNLILAIPTFTVLLPTFLSYPLNVPALLIVPHITYMVLFSTVILLEISRRLKSGRRPGSSVSLNK
jgi:membrane-bound metal-dependent hydrolase YbcI (DUF457 family)